MGSRRVDEGAPKIVVILAAAVAAAASAERTPTAGIAAVANTYEFQLIAGQCAVRGSRRNSPEVPQGGRDLHGRDEPNTGGASIWQVLSRASLCEFIRSSKKKGELCIFFFAKIF